MDVILQQKKETILHAFEKTPGYYWKTLDEIAAFSKVKLEDVIKIVFREPEFMRSVSRSETGLPFITTSKVFWRDAPWYMKLLRIFQEPVR